MINHRRGFDLALGLIIHRAVGVGESFADPDILPRPDRSGRPMASLSVQKAMECGHLRVRRWLSPPHCSLQWGHRCRRTPDGVRPESALLGARGRPGFEFRYFGGAEGI